MSEIAVIGLGYVGLPLAVQAAEKGYTVKGIDLNAELVSKVNNRRSPYVNDARFKKALAALPREVFVASSNYDDIDRSDVVIICVPTPTENNTPDLTLVIRAAQQVAEHLHPGQLIVLESTVNPGATRGVVLPLLESASGLRAGEGFSLAHCPERIDPGNPQFYVGNLNRVVGGITPTCTAKAAKFYRRIIDSEILPLGSVEEAEFVKSWENSHRNVMIALANTSAIMCDALGMNIDNVLAGLNTKVAQFGLSLARPGIGVGGHCIPEDIHYIIRSARVCGIDTRFLDSAADLNDLMPRYSVHQLQELVASHGERLDTMNVALLGLAYKPNIGDARRSPAVEVAYHLARYSNSVKVHDPFVVSNKTTHIHGTERHSSLADTLRGSDVVFLATAHDQYLTKLTPQLLKKQGIKYVYDGRNCLDREALAAVGIVYKGIGR